jgi:hypothetical protein
LIFYWIKFLLDFLLFEVELLPFLLLDYRFTLFNYEGF